MKSLRPSPPPPEPAARQEVVRSIPLLLYDAARLIRRDFDRRAREHGLTRATWQVLAHLSYSQGIRQGGLAEILDIEPITLVRLLDRLEEAGLVERRADPTDRRARTLYLTAAAYPVIEQIRSLAAETRSVGLAGLSADEQDQLIDLLTRIRANLAERGLQGEPGDEAADKPAGAQRGDKDIRHA